MKAIASSVTERRFTPLVHPRRTPCRAMARRSSMSMPTPYLLITSSSGRAARTPSSMRSRAVITLRRPRANATNASPSSATPSSLNRTSGYLSSSSARSTGCREKEREATAIGVLSSVSSPRGRRCAGSRTFAGRRPRRPRRCRTPGAWSRRRRAELPLTDRAAAADAVDELGKLQLPRGIGVAEGGLLRRIADGEPLALAALDEPLVAVAAAHRRHAVHDDVAVLHVDLQGEAVLPLGGGAVDHRDAARLGAQQGEGVVLQGAVPERGRAHALDLGELAAEVAEQVEHVDALIEQDAAADQGRVAAPGRRIGGPFGLAVDAPHPEDAAVLAAVDDLLGLHDAEVVAVVEAELQHLAGVAPLRRHDPLDVVHGAARRLLAEDVLAGVQGRDDDIGDEAVGRADEHGVDAGVQDGLVVRRRARCRRSPWPAGRGSVPQTRTVPSCSRMVWARMPPCLPRPTMPARSGSLVFSLTGDMAPTLSSLEANRNKGSGRSRWRRRQCVATARQRTGRPA